MEVIITMQNRAILSILGVGLTLVIIMVACVESPEPNIPPTQPLATTPQVTQPPLFAATASAVTPIGEETMPSKPETPGASGPAENRPVTQAKEDLAERLSIEVDQIQLVEFRAVVWPDASLGCPQPGMAYKQVPQDGGLIRLEVDGRLYEYHSGGSRAPFLCERPLQIDKTTPPPSLDDI
jgi:hypothetical protein